MPSESARDFFGRHATAEERLTELQAQPEATQLVWETLSCSPHSPGPVKDEEQLIRAFDQPTHYRDGEILPAAFTDAAVRGLSCNRLAYTSVEAAMAQSGERVAAANIRRGAGIDARRTVAYATYSVAELRSLMFGNAPRRGLGVYDTGLADDTSHADICLLIPGKQAERSLRSLFFAATRESLVLV